LLNELAAFPDSFALVLDDYHMIENPAIHDTMTFLLDHLLLRMHLMITTRIDPPLPLSRLRVRGQLTELRAADLRFTFAEATTFLNNVMGLSLTAADIAALEERTEGWVAGLQLAALAMRNRTDLPGFVRAFTGSNRFIVDYLAGEVLARQPAHLQTFLLQTAILDRLCGPLCDAVMGLEETPSNSKYPEVSQPALASHSYSQILLEELERSNLFLVPLDNDRRWYRYHHLFADVMRARLAGGARAETVAALHRRASAWYETEGLINEAIRHALAAPDAGQAAALVERHYMAVLHQSHVFLIRSWLEQLPAGLVQTRPRLILAHSWALILTGHQPAVEQWLATPSITAALQAPDLPVTVRGELALLRATMARFRRNSASALELAQQVLDDFPEDNHQLRASAIYTMGVAQMQQGNIAAASQTLAEAASLGETTGAPYIALIALEELSALQARQGRLSQVIQTCQQANRLVARWGGRPMPAAGLAHVAIGEVLYERNDLDEAAQALGYGIDLLRGSIEQSVLVQGYVALARVQLARGQVEEAFTIIQQGEDWFTQMQVTALGARHWLALGLARLWLAQGQLAAAARWAETGQWWPEDTRLGCLQRLAVVRLHLAKSRHDPHGSFLADASQTLGQLLVQAEAGGWWGQLIEILAIQALVHQAQNDDVAALAALERALILAEPEGYIRIFVDEGEPMAILLQQAAAHGLASTYVSKLLTAFNDLRLTIDDLRLSEQPQTENSKSKIQNLVEPLSQRELELLRLVADGQSNQEIAQELFVAIGTVKKHLNNIFSKLDVSSRTQAIARARELDLL
jgi:LuxR family maltose regulon positive regulatory protein